MHEEGQGIAYKQSPNHSSREKQDTISIVIHYTGAGSAKGSVSWLCNPASKVSAHFVVNRKGGITQLVDLNRAAWHAGDRKINQSSIGIELANHGCLIQRQNKFYYQLGRRLFRYRGVVPVYGVLKYGNGLEVSGMWEPYTEAQLHALKSLLSVLPDVPIVGHSEIAHPPGRKRDPGPLFPWEFFRGD